MLKEVGGSLPPDGHVKGAWAPEEDTMLRQLVGELTSKITELDLDLPSAVYAVAAVLGWELPVRRRAVGRARWHSTALLAADARAALEQGDRTLARTLTRALAAATEDWAGAELLAAEVEGAAMMGSAR